MLFFLGKSAHNTSATSIYISWKPPSLDSILGEFLGYRITFRARDKQAESIKEIYIRDSSVEVCSIINLINYTHLNVNYPVFCFYHDIKSLSTHTKQSHEIQNLETFTQYLVSLQVFNPEGLGPPTTVLVMTDEGSK